MTIPIKHDKYIKSVAFIGNYLPRRCGIATFTTDLVEAFSSAKPHVNSWVLAINDNSEGYNYPENVHFEISRDTLEDYTLAAQFITINHPDVVCVQHEFGIFGGSAGSHILELLENIHIPVVTTLHTVLKDPDPEYNTVMHRLISLSDTLVVMSHMASDFLVDIYHVPQEKISLIHHGIPDTPFMDTCFYKDKYNLEGRNVLLTFGLLSPNKGIGYALQALPGVIDKHPDIMYLILGETHPNIVKMEGDVYLQMLQKMVRELELENHVTFVNRFVDLDELCEFLNMADIYLTPYLEEAQITSGTLAYAMGSGKAVISTPYWYAMEMLAENRGKLVPFRSISALKDTINDLLDNDIDRHMLRKNAYTYSRNAVWKKVAKEYRRVFSETRSNRLIFPHPRIIDNRENQIKESCEIYEIKLEHLKTLTDDTGILQHAVYTIPDRTHGYCTDDNARALLAAVSTWKYMLPEDACLHDLCGRYIGFLHSAFNEKRGCFRNFMTYSRNWMEETGSHDSHARAVWCLGKAVAILDDPGYLAMITALFAKAAGALEYFEAPRSMAFSLVGIHSYLQRYPGDSTVRRIGRVLSEKLFGYFKKNASNDWVWPESQLTYANGKLPHALLVSGQLAGNKEMIQRGLESLKWLMDIQSSEGHFVPVGNRGWYKQGGVCARFDQQPIEAHAMIDACAEAFSITGDEVWRENALFCFRWYLGCNDLKLSLYNDKTGGCRDGLNSDGVNPNEGAESSLAWLLSAITIQTCFNVENSK